jgi:antibiotic biosynthesis monooxygenase (ABM) superfamily enzyme
VDILQKHKTGKEKAFIDVSNKNEKSIRDLNKFHGSDTIFSEQGDSCLFHCVILIIVMTKNKNKKQLLLIKIFD